MASILLVEDEVLIRDLVTLRLEIAGHQISTAENGQIGYEKALELQPDLVLMDMHMPVMSGHEAVITLREKGYSGLVVALTASALTTETNQALTSGCDYFMTKPIPEDFEDKVAEMIENRQNR